VIAPLSANTLAKIANGICDNLLVCSSQTCVVRAWDVSKPMLLAPAMNTYMWENPFTSEHLTKVQQVYAAEVIDTVSKQLICGDTGKGAMAHVETIVSRVLAALER
jgi:phosphopantothenoylcysteine decarboxylase